MRAEIPRLFSRPPIDLENAEALRAPGRRRAHVLRVRTVLPRTNRKGMIHTTERFEKVRF